MELALIVATVARRYEFELRQDGLRTREGFLRKPLGCLVGMRLRGGREERLREEEKGEGKKVAGLE